MSYRFLCWLFHLHCFSERIQRRARWYIGVVVLACICENNTSVRIDLLTSSYWCSSYRGEEVIFYIWQVYGRFVALMKSILFWIYLKVYWRLGSLYFGHIIILRSLSPINKRLNINRRLCFCTFSIAMLSSRDPLMSHSQHWQLPPFTKLYFHVRPSFPYKYCYYECYMTTGRERIYIRQVRELADCQIYCVGV